MKNANIIDFAAYQKQRVTPMEQDDMLTEDLSVAIEILIQRLRNHQPIEKQAS